MLCLKCFKRNYLFLCRFATYKHMMAFWEQIEHSTHRMICVTSSRVTRETGLYVKTRALPAIDEFFLFMMHLALGLKQKDLAHRFHVHQTTAVVLKVGGAPARGGAHRHCMGGRGPSAEKENKKKKSVNSQRT